MIISFAYTAEAFLSGRKTVTRRVWKPRTLAMWQKAWDEGRYIHDAVDKALYRGGQRIGKLRLTCRPYQERLSDMAVLDLAAEGGLWATRQAFYDEFGGDPEQVVTVVRFEAILGGDDAHSQLYDAG